MAYECLETKTDGKVLTLTLSRPEALNALNAQLMEELADALTKGDEDNKVGAMVITGSEKAFAAGADIKEMAENTYIDNYSQNFMTGCWIKAANCRKPVIAAVAGYALGGGCELAMMCDFILAADNAKFGQPEITLATIPGIGGTQRLTRLIGKSKAMEMCLTGRMMDAEEAERAGLVSRIVPTADLLTEASQVAEKIAGFSRPIVAMAKEAVDQAYESTLSEGVHFERRIFHATFATEDQKEGMAAFIEKRKPIFKNR